MWSLEATEVLSKIGQNPQKKFEPPEWPPLEVREVFQWCQEMSLGVPKRFQGKKRQFFFRDLNFCRRFERLLHLANSF